MHDVGVQPRVQYRGQWWIEPGGKRWPGVFAFSNEEGGLLELEAESGDFPEPPSPDEIPLIFGQTVDGKAITLIRSVQTRAASHSPGGLEVKFDSRYALVGAFFESLEEIAFERVDFRLTGLDEWAGISGFDVDWTPTRTNVSFAAPDPVEIATAQGFTVRLDFSGGGLQMTRPLLTVDLDQKTRASIRADTPMPVETLAEHIHQVRNFFCFAQRRRSELHEVKTVIDVEVRRGGDRVETQPAIIDILYRADASIEHAGPAPRERMLFRLEDSADEPSRRPLTRWLANRDLLGPVYDLYLLGLYAPRTHAEFVYLSLTEGLEALHSRKFPDYDLPRAEHRKRMQAILAAAPPEWNDWLEEKLAHANKATFRAGLKELVLTLPPTLAGHLGDIDRFTQRVSWTRNYLTHWTPDLEKKAAKGGDLVRLVVALRLVLEALLLLEIGYSRNEIERLYEDNYAIKRDLRFAFGVD
jgi:hypothetical protein